MEHLLILLVGGLIVLVRKLFLEGGLSKMLGKLDSDLNQPPADLRRTTPPPMRREIAPSLSPEEVRMRKFREALGIPSEETASPTLRPVPPIVAPAMRPNYAEQAQRERERIERTLAEKKRILQQNLPPAIPQPKANLEDSSVSKYFDMDRFNKPGIEAEKIPEMAPIIEADFYKTLEKRELVTVSSATRISEIFGTNMDLRHLILAHEILGRPKSLQNT